MTWPPRSVATCPLCATSESGPSWLGITTFLGREYEYLECTGCLSLHCFPMPDGEALSQMYGPAYLDDPEVDRLKSRLVGGFLRRLSTGVFVDFGCGSGALLRDIGALGWEVVGFEFDPLVANMTAERTGHRVLLASEASSMEGRADAVHLGDVIEHLTDMDAQLPAILRLVKPGGVLLAQGPLEANANLFLGAIRAARSIRGRPDARTPRCRHTM